MNAFVSVIYSHVFKVTLFARDNHADSLLILSVVVYTQTEI